jgi:adenylate cyclase
MASFVDVDDAVKCGVAVQKAFTGHNLRKPDESLHIRIGLSAGEPVEEDGDFFGSAVQLAARICAHTEPDHILVSQIVRDECQAHRDIFVELGEIIDAPIAVHEVKWQ